MWKKTGFSSTEIASEQGTTVGRVNTLIYRIRLGSSLSVWRATRTASHRHRRRDVARGPPNRDRSSDVILTPTIDRT
jgi:hypothetical protein